MNVRQAALALALAMQLALPSLLTLIYPCEVLRAAGSAPAEIGNALSLTLLVLAAAVVWQSFRRGPIGSGLLLPSLSSGLHLAPSLLAVKAGGLPVVAAMTVFAGLGEMVFSFLVLRLRALFSNAVVGLILFLVGIEIALSGWSAIWQSSGPGLLAVATAAGVALALATRLSSPLAKTLVPPAVFVVSAVVGRSLRPPAAAHFSWLGWPTPPHLSFDFRPDLALPFLAVAVAAGVRALGGIQILHEDTRGTGAPRLAPGLRGDATATILCGLAGSMGTCIALNSIATERAAGTTNPRMAWPVAGVFILAALCPAVLGFVVMAPGCAVGPLLIYYGVLMALPGLAEINKDRGTPGFAWQVGLPLSLAAAALFHQQSLRFGAKPWPPALESLAGSLMTIGIVSALLVRLCLWLRLKKA